MAPSAWPCRRRPYPVASIRRHAAASGTAARRMAQARQAHGSQWITCSQYPATIDHVQQCAASGIVQPVARVYGFNRCASLVTSRRRGVGLTIFETAQGLSNSQNSLPSTSHN
jgi:glycine/D-amino acid oxidase-like deaminating enzyme